MKRENVKVGMRVWFHWITGRTQRGEVDHVFDDKPFAMIKFDYGDSSLKACEIPLSWLNPIVKKKRAPLISVTDADIIDAYCRVSKGVNPDNAPELGQMLIELRKLSDERRAKRKAGKP